jgi:hypothetical protein
MYKKRDRQMSFNDFNQPLGLELDPNNRWIKKAALIPWDEIEEKYARLFPARDGTVAKPAQMALGALIIQKEYGFSDEETVSMIQENPYFQYFCGMRTFTREAPFDPSLMVRFRKRFTSEVLSEINEKIIAAAQNKGHIKSDRESNSSRPDDWKDTSQGGAEGKGMAKPEGTLIVDATCAPSNIKYPTDTDILNKAREQTEQIIKMLRDKESKHPRTYARVAHKEHVRFSRKRKKTKKEIRRMVFKHLRYLRRNLRTIDAAENQGRLSKKWISRLEIIRTVYEQQKTMYEKRTHTVSQRIVSLSQPWLRPIVRGKTKAPVEFGAKLDISVSDEYVRLETASFEAYNESGMLSEEIERYKKRTGHYPERVLADKIYRNRENLKYCKALGIRLSGPALGRRPKDYSEDKKQEYRDICERTEVERAFSLAKRKYGMGMLYTRLRETTLNAIALSIVVLNLSKVQLCAQNIVKYLVKLMMTALALRQLEPAVQ